MYIVTRTFRDANGVFGVGSIVDPTSVKTFRSRLQQRHIVDVDATNIAEWAEFFKNRYGIDLSEQLADYIKDQPKVEEPIEEFIEEPIEEPIDEPEEAAEIVDEGAEDTKGVPDSSTGW